MKSFAEWAAVGRSVRKGEKARYRRVNEDRTLSIPLFEEDQTDELGDVGVDWKIISAAEWDELKATSNKPKVILADRGDVITVWVGNNKKAIEQLRKANYWFNMRSHRWCRQGKKTLDEVKEGWEYLGYRVEVEE